MNKNVSQHKLAVFNPNYYSGGGFASGFKSGLGTTGLNASGLGSAIGGSIGGLGTAAGKLAGGLISNGYESTAGSIINTIGDIGGMIPGPWGAIIGGGASLIGGAVNALFGTKVDEEKLKEAKAGTEYLQSFKSEANSFDEIQGPNAVTVVRDPYSGGLFAKGKARRKNQALKDLRNQAESFAFRSVDNNVDNIAGTQTQNLEANYSAFGGPLFLPSIGGAIDYELAQQKLAQQAQRNQGGISFPRYAFGGVLSTQGGDWSNGITFINNGGTHEENPMQGVPMGMDEEGNPNLVEEGEVIWNDYVFSDRIAVPDEIRTKYKLKGKKGMTFADAAKKLQRASEERPNDPIVKKTLNANMTRLAQAQEMLRQESVGQEGQRYAHGGTLGLLFDGTGEIPQFLRGPQYEGLPAWLMGNVEPQVEAPKLTPMQQIAKDKSTPDRPVTVSDDGLNFVVGTPSTRSAATEGKEGGGNNGTNKTSPWSALRYVPALGAGISVFSDLMGWTNKPDYGNALMLEQAADSIPNVSFTPIGNYLTYTPLDRLFYINQLNANAGASRRAIANQSGGNRGAAIAGILASDYNANNNLANLIRQAEEFNLAQRQKVAEFNRGTDMFNSEGFMKASTANSEVANSRAKLKIQGAQMRDAIDARASAAKSANLTNLFDSLGDIGREQFTMDMIKNNPALLYDWMGNYKGGKKACGGMLTKRH